MLMAWGTLLRDRRRAAMERELDRQQAELRASILKLASELRADAHEARKALVRESFVTRVGCPAGESDDLTTPLT